MFVRSLNDELQKKASSELNEDPERVQEDMHHIKEWIVKQPHLKIRNDDQCLINYLRVCKFNMEETKRTIDLFYKFKILLPEYYTERDPFLPDIQEFLSKGIFLSLRIPPDDPAASKLMILRPGCADLENLSFTNYIKTLLMILDMLSKEDDNFVVAGQNILVDLKNVPYKHAVQLTPSILKKLIMCLRYGYRLRVKKIHVINAVPVFRAVYKIAEAFVSNKVSKRIIFYNDDNFNSIFKTVPLSIIPKEYGGEGSSLQELIVDMKNKIESHKDWFMKNEVCYSDESKRSDGSVIEEDLFGLDGYFRKLNVD